MAGSFTVDGTDTTVTFEYTAPTDTIISVVGDAAEYLWKEEIEIVDDVEVVTNPFDEATNQEKLDVVDAHIKKVITNLANTFKSNEAQRLAREAEEADKYSI